MKLTQFSNGKVKYWGISGDRIDMNAYMSLWGDRKPIDLLEKNLIAGFVDAIDPFLTVSGNLPVFDFSFELLPAISPGLIGATALLRTVDRPEIAIDWEQLNATPERLKFQITQKAWVCDVHQHAWEIGRFITQKNEVGIIKSIQTEVSFNDNDLRWPLGDSGWFNRALSADNGQAQISWCLKIETLPMGILENGFRNVGIITPAEWFREIPGVVHPEIEPWYRMLFLWGYDHDVHFICPPNSLVSLWVYQFPIGLVISGIRQLGGMMKGYTQIMESARTYENLTREY